MCKTITTFTLRFLQRRGHLESRWVEREEEPDVIKKEAAALEQQERAIDRSARSCRPID